MVKSDRWLMGEIHLHVPKLTTEGRDAIVSWLRNTADKIERSKCGHWDFEQPDRKYKLRVGN